MIEGLTHDMFEDLHLKHSCMKICIHPNQLLLILNSPNCTSDQSEASRIRGIRTTRTMFGMEQKQAAFFSTESN